MLGVRPSLLFLGHKPEKKTSLTTKRRYMPASLQNVKDDLKEAHGVILVYAVDDRQSVESVKSIFQEIRLRRRDNVSLRKAFIPSLHLLSV